MMGKSYSPRYLEEYYAQIYSGGFTHGPSWQDQWINMGMAKYIARHANIHDII